MATVSLNRQFRVLTSTEDREQAALDSYAALTAGPGDLSWDDVLKNQVTVVLGEPGSGKSEEFRAKAAQLRESGLHAFYLRLDDLVENDFEQLLPAEDLTQIREWKSGAGIATFLLDSVDEAKLHQPSDFSKALRRFRSLLSHEAVSRARIVISSRISEWRPKMDADAVAQALARPPLRRRDSSGDAEDKQLVVVQLEGLDAARIRLFAESMGLPDASAFLAAIEAQHAWPFARRPLDVLSLINYWRKNKSLGRLVDLIEYDVDQKLREHDANRSPRDPLVPAAAREGAEYLAASALFCKSLSFQIADRAGLADGRSLDPAECVPANWSAGQLAALLSRPLFDAENYGRTRFHHRQVLEYLAARWIDRRMRHGCPRRDLRTLLFEGDVLRPSMAPVAAWLTIGTEKWNDSVRQWVLSSAPWIHLQHGDPASLTDLYCRQVLSSLADHYRARVHAWVRLDTEALARFGRATLVPDLLQLIRDRTLPADLRGDFLMLAQNARLLACQPAAIEILHDAAAPLGLKQRAAFMLRELKDPPFLAQFATWALTQTSLDGRLCSFVFESLFPSPHFGAVELAAVLRKIDEVPEFSVGVQWYLRRHLEAVLTPAAGGDVLKELVALARTAPTKDQGFYSTPLSKQFAWLVEAIPGVLATLLSSQQLNPEEVAVATDALVLLDGHERLDRRKEEAASIATHSLRHPAVRRVYFWTHVQAFRKFHKKEPTWLPQIAHFSVLTMHSSDITWLAKDAKEAGDPADRAFALACCIDLVPSVTPWPQRWAAAGRLLAHLPGAFFAVAKRLIAALPRRMLILYYRHGYKFRRHHWRHYVRTGKNWLVGEWILLRNLKVLTSGMRFDWLIILIEEINRDENLTRWAPSSFEKLRRGRAIRKAAELGSMAFWRSYLPTLPHERPDPNATDKRVVVGLMGIALEFRRPNFDAALLSDADARVMTRYATNELNGFPEWLPELARHHPAAVRAVLAECIAGEWEIPRARELVHQVLADLRWYAGDLSRPSLPDIAARFATSDPKNPMVLQQALEILVADGAADRELAAWAPARIRDYAEGDKAFSLWLMTWLYVDAEPALDFLATQLVTSTAPDAVMLNLSSELRGERPTQKLRATPASYVAPEALRRLIPMTFACIRPGDDTELDGFVTPRHRAQEFRDSLLNILAQSSHVGADQALEELIGDPAMVIRRDWIIELRSERRGRLADGQPWRPQDIRNYADRFERTPTTERDLFDIAVSRFFDIKDEVELANNSPRGQLNVTDQEAALRKWLAARLDAESRDLYTVPQEEEIDLGQPDIRFNRPGIGPIAVEIKWGGRWSGEQLFERLENQLIGQYMRAVNSRHGIYLVGRIGNRRHWERNGVDRTLSETARMLQDRADSICRPLGASVKVITIDFVHPSAITVVGTGRSEI